MKLFPLAPKTFSTLTTEIAAAEDGGAEGHAVVVNDPWEVMRRLKIDCSKID